MDARLSEDEIALCEAALGYVLDSLDAEQIERRFGASVDEIEGIRDDLRDVLAGRSETGDGAARDASGERVERHPFAAT